jgi:protein-tyrosine phosphatase
MTGKMQSTLPIKFSYKVTDIFYAGEYPFEEVAETGIVKLKRLTDFGIKHFIDLTSERLTRYNDFLPKHCTYTKMPTNDYTVPSFENLKTIHDIINQSNEKVYVHCKGGHDRTGAVVAMYFIHAGFSPPLAKQKFYEVFIPPVKGRYPHSPLIETKWKILELYKEWLSKNT